MTGSNDGRVRIGAADPKFGEEAQTDNPALPESSPGTRVDENAKATDGSAMLVSPIMMIFAAAAPECIARTIVNL